MGAWPLQPSAPSSEKCRTDDCRCSYSSPIWQLSFEAGAQACGQPATETLQRWILRIKIRSKRLMILYWPHWIGEGLVLGTLRKSQCRAQWAKVVKCGLSCFLLSLLSAVQVGRSLLKLMLTRNFFKEPIPLLPDACAGKNCTKHNKTYHWTRVVERTKSDSFRVRLIWVFESHSGSLSMPCRIYSKSWRDSVFQGILESFNAA